MTTLAKEVTRLRGLLAEFSDRLEALEEDMTMLRGQTSPKSGRLAVGPPACLGSKVEAEHDLDPENQWTCRRCGGWNYGVYVRKLADDPRRGLYAPHAYELDGTPKRVP